MCFDLSQPKTKGREVRALVKASDALSCDTLTAITEDMEATEQVTWGGVTRQIRFVPLWKWLL